MEESEESFRLLVESAPEAIFVQSQDRFLYLNPPMLKLLGAQKPEQLLGTDFSGRVAPEFREAVRERIRLQRETGKPAPPMAQEYLRLDGSRVPVEPTAVPIHYQGWEAHLVFVRDITERRRAEEALQEARQLYESVFQASPLAIVLTTEAEGRYLAANAAHAHMTGYPADEVLGRTVAEFNAWRTPEDRARMVKRLGQEGHVHNAEVVFRRRSGEPFPALLSMVPVVVNRQRCIISFVTDITERKRLEEELRQVQKMEAVGQLAGGIAHDFNNILTATLMNLALLQGNPNLDPPTREGLKELEVGANRAANLTRQLLLFSRRSQLETRVLDLNETVANLLKMLGRLLGEHITLIFERSHNLPLVEADAGMLEQVLMNLAVNARDAMPGGGRITLVLHGVEVTVEQAARQPSWRVGRFVCLSVSDTGCGMDPVTLKRVFEPFFTTKEPGRGTGLGLATVYGIVAQHKGWVEVESEVGHGTTFRVFLPATAKTAVDSARTEAAALMRGHETVLLVEDEESVRRVAGQILRRMGYRVLEACHGPEALRVWRENQGAIDLLLSDMVMPEGMTGLDLAERLREVKPDLKVIVTSGYSPEILAQSAPTERRVLRLQKPYQPEELSKIVRECLDRG